MKLKNYIIFFLCLYIYPAIAEDAQKLRCDSYPAGGNMHKICFLHVDGVDVPHGKHEIVNNKGVVVFEANYERGEEVGFLVNRADDGDVLKVCYYIRGKKSPDCIDL